MSSAPMGKLFRTTSFRVSLIHATLLVVAFAIAVVGTFIATRDAAERELRDRIELETHAVAHAIETGGIDAGAQAVTVRAERPGSLEYRLVDETGRLVAGDLPVVDGAPGWAVVRLAANAPGAEGRERLLILSERMPDGSRLIVGDDIDRAERVRDAVLATLFVIAVVALLLSLAAGALLTRSALKRMEAVAATVHAFSLGEASARAPVRAGANDDIDDHARDINAMLDRIGALMANLRRVSADVAHDLRTPLSQARQKLEAALATDDPGKRHAALLALGGKIDQALKTFDAMLRLAEIEAGAARSRFASIDLSETVEIVADAYRLDVEATGRQFAIGPLDVGRIEGDDELIGQALANLIENAMRHTPKHATIRLAVKKTADHLSLIVEDDGPGIPRSRRLETLAPFTRLDDSRTTPGSGLGLPIVAAVARLHEAQLLLDDAEPGLRVTMEFELTADRP